jgi:1,6-anhydro-N-acetylmuramate kinase
MEQLTLGNHSRSDVAMLNWGRHEEVAREQIQAVFDFRLKVVGSIFQEIGFEGDELEMRTHTMVFFQTLEGSPYNRLSQEERLKNVKLRYPMLIKNSA